MLAMAKDVRGWMLKLNSKSTPTEAARED